MNLFETSHAIDVTITNTYLFPFNITQLIYTYIFILLPTSNPHSYLLGTKFPVLSDTTRAIQNNCSDVSSFDILNHSIYCLKYMHITVQKSVKSYSFGIWWLHAQFQTPSTAPSERIWVRFFFLVVVLTTGKQCQHPGWQKSTCKEGFCSHKLWLLLLDIRMKQVNVDRCLMHFQAFMGF